VINLDDFLLLSSRPEADEEHCGECDFASNHHDLLHFCVYVTRPEHFLRYDVISLANSLKHIHGPNLDNKTLCLSIHNAMNLLSNRQAAGQARTLDTQQVHKALETIFFLDVEVLETFSATDSAHALQLWPDACIVES
jgi:hypothetical protein